MAESSKVHFLLSLFTKKKIRGKKKSSPEAEGKNVLILWIKLKWFFQHSFWSFCSALKVKQNTLTRAEACAGNMSPRAGKKVSGCFQTMRMSDLVLLFFFFECYAEFLCDTVLLCVSVQGWIWTDLDCRMPMVSRGKGNRHLWFEGITFSREDLKKCNVEYILSKPKCKINLFVKLECNITLLLKTIEIKTLKINNVATCRS